MEYFLKMHIQYTLYTSKTIIDFFLLNKMA